MVNSTPICLHSGAEQGTPPIHHSEPEDEDFHPNVTGPWNEENAGWWGGEQSHGPLQGKKKTHLQDKTGFLEGRLAFLFLNHMGIIFFKKHACVMKAGMKLKTHSNPEMAVVLEISCPEWIRERERVMRCPPPINKQKCKYPRCLLHPPQGEQLINQFRTFSHCSWFFFFTSCLFPLLTLVASFQGHSSWGRRHWYAKILPTSPLLAGTCRFPLNVSCSAQQVWITWTNICSLLNHVYPRKRQTPKAWD